MIDGLTQKIKTILSKTPSHQLQDVILIKNDDGKYELFNRFVIEKKSPYEVLVTKLDSNIKNSFTTSKNAVSWCIFYNNSKLYEADRILELDRKLIGLEMEILNHKRLFRKSNDIEEKLVYLTKISEDKLKKQLYSKQLAKLIQDSDIYQQRKFKQHIKV